MPTSEVKIVEGSIEYLYADIRADQVLDEQVVQISISTISSPGVWVAATWIGSPSKYRSARVLLTGSLPAGVYFVFARLFDAPEAPIIYVGKLRIV